MKVNLSSIKREIEKTSSFSSCLKQKRRFLISTATCDAWRTTRSYSKVLPGCGFEIRGIFFFNLLNVKHGSTNMFPLSSKACVTKNNLFHLFVYYIRARLILSTFHSQLYAIMTTSSKVLSLTPHNYWLMSVLPHLDSLSLPSLPHQLTCVKE